LETILDLILGGTELQLIGFLVLCAVSFLGSMVAAALGLGGGLLVIATMALYLSPAVLIPVHGVVQLGSNLGRAVLMARHVLKSVLPAFVVGTVLGATGPLVAPFAAAANKDRQGVVATHAILMTIQHSLKVVAFGFLGFAFGPYIPLLIGLIACGFAGTWTGRHILNRLPEKAFRIGLKTILTLLALRLLYGALADLALKRPTTGARYLSRL